MTAQSDSTVTRIVSSFKYAFEGVAYVFRTQRNAQIHAVISVAVVGLGLWLSIELRDWAVLVLAMMIVWVAEIFNTSIEAHINMTAPDKNSNAKIAKDAAAAAVLVGAIGS
ncbi:MAG: diacylglycerol kinase family protein, partial [Candidatus Promineifilaceae bacterium]